MCIISGKAELASRDELNMGLLCSGARSPNYHKGCPFVFNSRVFVIEVEFCSGVCHNSSAKYISLPTWQWLERVTGAHRRCCTMQRGGGGTPLATSGGTGSTGKVHVDAASPFVPPCCRPLIPHCSFGARSTQTNVSVFVMHITMEEATLAECGVPLL